MIRAVAPTYTRTETELCPDGPPFLTHVVTEGPLGRSERWICEHAHWHADEREARRCNEIPTFGREQRKEQSEP